MLINYPAIINIKRNQYQEATSPLEDQIGFLTLPKGDDQLVISFIEMTKKLKIFFFDHFTTTFCVAGFLAFNFFKVNFKTPSEYFALTLFSSIFSGKVKERSKEL